MCQGTLKELSLTAVPEPYHPLPPRYAGHFLVQHAPLLMQVGEAFPDFSLIPQFGIDGEAAGANLV